MADNPEQPQDDLGEDTEDDMMEMVVTGGEDGDPEEGSDDEGEPEGSEGEEESSDESQDDDELTTLRNELQSANARINQMGFALRENDRLRAELEAAKGKPKDDGEASFTDAQLLQMMRENENKPEVIFQIMKEMNRQTGQKAEKSAEAKVQVQQRDQQLRQMVEQSFRGVFESNTGYSTAIQQTKDFYDLGNHPHGDVLAVGLMTLNDMPRIRESLLKQGREAALGTVADGKRKQNIQGAALAGSKGKTKSAPKKAKLDSTAMETAKRLGMNEKQQKRYMAMLKAAGSDGTLTAEI